MNKIKYGLMIFLVASCCVTMFGQQRTRPLLGLEPSSTGKEIVPYVPEKSGHSGGEVPTTGKEIVPYVPEEPKKEEPKKEEPKKEEPKKEEPTKKEEEENEKYTKEMLDKLEKSLTKGSGGTLGGLVEKIGRVVSTSLCKDRAFTIMPNIGVDGKMARGFMLLTNKR